MTSGHRPATPQVWSHRGRVDPPASFADNTVAAVSNALTAGAGGAEIDTWLAADGIFVMTHDRETPSGPVDRCNSADLGGLDRLDDVLAVTWRGALNIELKVPPDSSPAEQARLGAELASHLQRCAGRADFDTEAVVVSSFSEVATAAMLDAGCRLRLGHLCLDMPGEDRLEYLAGRGYWGIHFLATEGSVAGVASIHAARLAAVAWTVNVPDLAGRLAVAGVDVIITDTPVAVAGVTRPGP